MYFEIIIITALIILITASLKDIQLRMIPDYLSYFTIIIAVLIRITWALNEWSLNPLIWVIPSFAILFSFSFMMYKLGQWGGGDVKLLAGLSILLASSPMNETIPLFITYFMNILIAGGIYGLIAFIFLGIIKFKTVKKYLQKKDLIPLIIVLSITPIILLTTPLILALIITTIMIILSLIKYLKLIEEKCFIKKISTKNLVEGDWLTKPVKAGSKTIKPKGTGLSKEEIKLLQKHHEKVEVKDGLPFIPAFLLALIITIFWNNILINLII